MNFTRKFNVLIIEEITHSKLTQSLPKLEALNVCYISDWSKVDSNYKYFSIRDESAEKLLGAFCLFFSKRKGMLHLSNPPFFQNCGLWIDSQGKNLYYQNSYQKKILKSLADFLGTYNWVNISFPPECIDMQPFYWEGFVCKVRYTYRLRTTEFNELNNASKGLKSSIKALKYKKISIHRKLDSQATALLENSSLQGRKQTESDYFKKLLEVLKTLETFSVVKAEVKQGAGVSCGVRVGDTLVYLFGGVEKTEGLSLGTASLYELISNELETNLELIDFEGSMIPGVERYFRSFGAELIPFYNVTKEPALLGVKKALNI